MLAEIKSLAEKLAPRLIEIRRHIHAHPELSGEEQQTAAYVSGVLSSCGIAVQESVGKTGVVGNLRGQGTDPRTLGIRVDMDALPIQECTNLDYASTRMGVMHACGHDVHTTVGLGAAMVLAQLRRRSAATSAFYSSPPKKLPRERNGWSMTGPW